jgi:hypothetical protein
VFGLRKPELWPWQLEPLVLEPLSLQLFLQDLYIQGLLQLQNKYLHQLNLRLQ